jgi:hypothetical protein
MGKIQGASGPDAREAAEIPLASRPRFFSSSDRAGLNFNELGTGGARPADLTPRVNPAARTS